MVMPSSASFRAIMSSSADANLSPGCLAVALRTTASISGDTAGFSREGAGTLPFICIIATLTAFSPSNGTFPVSISYITMPSEYISDFASTNPPRACSGER